MTDRFGRNFNHSRPLISVNPCGVCHQHAVVVRSQAELSFLRSRHFLWLISVNFGQILTNLYRLDLKSACDCWDILNTFMVFWKTCYGLLKNFQLLFSGWTFDKATRPMVIVFIFRMEDEMELWWAQVLTFFKNMLWFLYEFICNFSFSCQWQGRDDARSLSRKHQFKQ